MSPSQAGAVAPARRNAARAAVMPGLDHQADDPQADALRAKYAAAGRDAARAQAAASASPMAGAAAGKKLVEVKICHACQAHGTVKRQYGYRVIDEVCEVCGGEGCITNKPKPASEELARKIRRVEALVATAEDLEALEALEAALKAKTIPALDAVLTKFAAAEPEAEPAAEPAKEERHLTVEGMSSEADAEKLQRALASMDGVVSAKVELEAKTAKVVGAPVPSEQQLAQAAVVAGFNASVKKLADDEVVVDFADVLRAFVDAGISEMSDTKPADPYRKMYELLFQASLVDYTTSPAAADKSKWDSDFVAKFGLPFHGDAVIALKGKGTGPKSGVRLMLADAGDFFSELSKKMKATGAPLTGAMTAEELKAADAAATKMKIEKLEKEQAERDAADAINAVRSAEMEASGKKVSGGLHKFDASEVDVNGGSATADDFMDAFGF